MHRESVSDLHMPGRPRIPVNWEQLQALHGNCGLCSKLFVTNCLALPLR